ncbi:MAG: hypothetical protein KC518_13400, partial [Candidatus Cloacimonetes bacterium]|nr:hypothetical protein [Candidatus Cloacimonadota bacterium]
AVRTERLCWPGLDLQLEKGTFQRLHLPGPGRGIWMLRFEGRSRATLSARDSLEALLLQSGDGADLQSRRIRSFLLLCDRLPAELESLSWQPVSTGLFARLNRRLGNDDAAAMARTAWPSLLIDFLQSDERGESLAWLQFRRPRLWARLSGGGSDPLDPSTLLLRPLHFGSSLFRPMAELADDLPDSGVGREQPAPYSHPDWTTDSLALELNVDAVLSARWTARLNGTLTRPSSVIPVRLDPGARLDSVHCAESPVSLWLPHAGGLDSPGSPLIYLIFPEELPAGRLHLSLFGEGSLNLATRNKGGQLEYPLRAWHPEPADGVTRVPWVRLDLESSAPLALGISNGILVPPGDGDSPSRLQCMIRNARLPVLHALPRRQLQTDDGMSVFVPEADPALLAGPANTGTSFWRYEKDTVLDSVRPWRPGNPAAPESGALLDPVPGDGFARSLAKSNPGRQDGALADLLPLNTALSELLLPLDHDPVLLAEWRRSERPESDLRDLLYSPAAGDLPGRLPAAAVWNGGGEAALQRATALAGQWWGGVVSLENGTPDWLRDGLRLATALIAVEQVHGVSTANRLRDLAHARILNHQRYNPHPELALPLLGSRADGGWHDPGSQESLDWRFALLLQNLRDASRDPASLSDARFRRFLRDLYYSLQSGSLNLAVMQEKLSQHLGPWAGGRFADFQSRIDHPEVVARLQQGDGVLDVHLTRPSDSGTLTVPLLIQPPDGEPELYFLELTELDQHFLLDLDLEQLAGFRLDPWFSLSLEVEP